MRGEIYSSNQTRSAHHRMSNAPDTALLLEALLLSRGGNLSVTEAAKLLAVSERDVAAASRTLTQSLETRGVVLVDDGAELEMRVSPAVSEKIASIEKEELSRDLGKAALETLAIVIYKGPSTKADIEFIRGVNSSYILRALLIRGLIRKVENPAHARSFLYEPTTELLSFLGVERMEQLPEYMRYRSEIEALLMKKEESPASLRES